MFFLNERIPRGILTNSKAGIAQLVERNLAKVEVASSNLVSRSMLDFIFCSVQTKQEYDLL